MDTQVAIKDLLFYLSSPNKEVTEEVHKLLLKQLDNIKEGWLTASILEYFLHTKSVQVLDILLSLPTQHDKQFLSALSDVFKQQPLEACCLLIYSLQHSPLPSWLRCLPRHHLMKELNAAVLKDQSDAVVIASILVVIAAIVAALPNDVAQHCLTDILELFCRLLKRSASPENMAEELFIHVSLYTLFVRLYGLFPVHLTNCIRSKLPQKDFERQIFTQNLKPMIERVRLNPLLLINTKEAELEIKGSNSTNWQKSQLFCSRLMLDAVESSCDSPPQVIDPEVCVGHFVDNTNRCWVHRSNETFFWSPSHVQSPSPFVTSGRATSSHTTPQPPPITTPIYTRTPLRPHLTPRVIPESPPEAAIEATPETTPYTTPLLSEHNRCILAQSLGTSAPVINIRNCEQMSAAITHKEVPDSGREGAMAQKLCALKKERDSVWSHRSDEASSRLASESNIKTVSDSDRQRNHSNKENVGNDANEGVDSSRTEKLGSIHISDESSCLNILSLQGVDSSNSVLQTAPLTSNSSNVNSVEKRTRKKSVFSTHGIDLITNRQSVHFNVDSNTFSSTSDEIGIKTVDENSANSILTLNILPVNNSKDLFADGDEVRKISTETAGSNTTDEDEERVAACDSSHVTELIKSARSNRLRFLSHCGNPLSTAQIESIMPEEKTNHTKPKSVPLHRSQSFTSVHTPPSHLQEGEGFFTGLSPGSMFRNPSTAKALYAVKPLKFTAEVQSSSTQTEGSYATDPYSKLTDGLLAMVAPSRSREKEDAFQYPSPRQLLECYFREHINWCLLPGSKMSDCVGAEKVWMDRMRILYCMFMHERQKREYHVNRTRSVLVKSKRMHEEAERLSTVSKKIEAHNFEIRDLKINNLYLSDHYERMIKSRDKENAEKEVVLNEYCKNHGSFQGTVATGLWRTIKNTQKGGSEETKEKVFVILHKASCQSIDESNDILSRKVTSLMNETLELRQECLELRKRMFAVEQTKERSHTHHLSTEELLVVQKQLKHQLESSRVEQHKHAEACLNFKDQLRDCRRELCDMKHKSQYLSRAWIEEKRKYEERFNAMNGLVNSLVCSMKAEEELCKQQQEEQNRIYLSALKTSDEQKKKIAMLEEKVRGLTNHNLELETNLQRCRAEKKVLKEDLDRLRAVGYNRSKGRAANNDELAEVAFLDESLRMEKFLQGVTTSVLGKKVSDKLEELPTQQSTRKK